MFKILKTKGTYISFLVFLVFVGTWFLLVGRGSATTHLARPAGNECSLDTRTGEACSYGFPCLSVETCASIEDDYVTTLASLEEYFLGPAYESPAEHSNPDVPLVHISTQKVHTSPFALLLKKIQNSQFAAASRSLISGEDEAIVSYPYQLPANATVWDLAQVIIPPEYLSTVVEYREESDGPRHMLAYVEPVDARGESWALVVDPVDAYADGVFNNPEKIITTLVHEFGHAISLNETQINRNARGACAEGIYEALEGCSYPDAHLQKFVDAFWLDILDEFLTLSESQKLYFYGKYSDRFINSYAATDPGEDFAESFAYYVVTKQRGSDTIAHQKIEHFYSDPEFIRIRDYMRRQMVVVMDQLK